MSVKVSVVLNTFNNDPTLGAALLSLVKNQSSNDFEVIVVDDGSKDSTKDIVYKYSEKYPGRISYYYQENSGCSAARNFGAKKAKGGLLIFFDDDAIAHPDFVRSHVEAHKIKGIMGVRGKVIPKEDLVYNYFQNHYDLGNEVISWHINMEANCSFKKDIFLKAGGFPRSMFGGEGIALSNRIIDIIKDEHCLIYYPDAVIYHNFSDDLQELLKKTYRYGLAKGEKLRRAGRPLSTIITESNYILKDLFLPSAKHWWMVYKDNEDRLKNTLIGTITTFSYTWTKKFAELKGFFNLRYE